MSKIRVVGRPFKRNAVNSTHQQMYDWLLQFDGCMFTEEDWNHFIGLAIDKAKALMYAKPSPWRIELHIGDNTIDLSAHNGKTGGDKAELSLDVIEIKSEYSRSMGVPEPYLPFKTGSDDSSEEGGER